MTAVDSSGASSGLATPIANYELATLKDGSWLLKDALVETMDNSVRSEHEAGEAAPWPITVHK